MPERKKGTLAGDLLVERPDDAQVECCQNNIKRTPIILVMLHHITGKEGYEHDNFLEYNESKVTIDHLIRYERLI